jgi:hypothetical protein
MEGAPNMKKPVIEDVAEKMKQAEETVIDPSSGLVTNKDWLENPNA